MASKTWSVRISRRAVPSKKDIATAPGALGITHETCIKCTRQRKHPAPKFCGQVVIRRSFAVDTGQKQEFMDN